METKEVQIVDCVTVVETASRPTQTPVNWEPFPQPRGWGMMCDGEEFGCCGESGERLPSVGSDPVRA